MYIMVVFAGGLGGAAAPPDSGNFNQNIRAN